MATREAVYEALFDLAKTSAGYENAHRGLAQWDETLASPAAQPAMFQVEEREHTHWPSQIAPIQTFKPKIIIMCTTTDKNNVAASTLLNGLITALEAALAPLPGAEYCQTLGGIVHHARINGETEIVEVLNGITAFAKVPIEILVTN